METLLDEVSHFVTKGHVGNHGTIVVGVNHYFLILPFLGPNLASLSLKSRLFSASLLLNFLFSAAFAFIFSVSVIIFFAETAARSAASRTLFFSLSFRTRSASTFAFFLRSSSFALFSSAFLRASSLIALSRISLTRSFVLAPLICPLYLVFSAMLSFLRRFIVLVAL